MRPHHEPRFLVDFMLGRLAKWLRILGYDTEYVTNETRSAILLMSLKENRVVITRDHRLSGRRLLKFALVDHDLVEDQLRQLIADRLVKVREDRLFTRCSVCNGEVETMEKEAARELVPDYVYRITDSFTRCKKCGKVYWTGSHRELLRKDLGKAGVHLP